MKYLGVGLSRTGTTSLTEAFKILGYKCCHYNPKLFEDFIFKDCPDINYDIPFDVVTDIPAALLYKNLKKKYPELKAVLTIRDEESWYQSVKNHYETIHERIENLNVEDKLFLHKAADLLQKKCYGSNIVTRKYIDYYKNHNENILKYFQKNDILIINIQEKDNWQKLCQFTGKKMINTSFPWKNKKWTNYRRIF